MPFDELDNIMDSMRPAGPPLIPLPFTTPGAVPGQLVSGKVQFKVRQIHEGGMAVELVTFSQDGGEDNQSGEDLKVIPSPS